MGISELTKRDASVGQGSGQTLEDANGCGRWVLTQSESSAVSYCSGVRVSLRALASVVG